MVDEKTNSGSEDSEDQEPKKDIPLFREEALKHRKVSYLGKNIIISPISYSVWTLGIFFVAASILLFGYFGSYAKKQDVRGMLIPNKGLINVYAKNPGVVAKRFVKQGEQVTQGQLLYLISTEQHTLSAQGSFEQQIKLLEKQIELQKSKFEISKKNMERYKKLLDERIISEADYQKLHQEHIDIEYSLNRTEQELINAKGSGDYAIRSPANGTIATLIAIVGDRVMQDKPLAVIVPKGARLQGMLFVPTSAIGFVKIGQKVLLKYDAYPYQSFGLYDATVVRIDKSVLFPKDVDMPLLDPEKPYANEPFYRVIVDLSQQTVNVYGEPYPLTPGMTLNGSMLRDKRKIWQWILDPIYSLRGSLTAS